MLIFEKGDEGDCAYLVEAGEVEISNPLTGFIFSRVGQGELFGEIALIDHQPRTATARASKSTTLVKIDRLLIEELLKKTDPIIQHLLSISLKRLRFNMLPNTLIDSEAKQFPDALQSVIANLANQRLALLQDLSFALSSEQFVLHYQPIVFLQNEKVAGFEALIRWNNPKMGLLPPLEFLGMAEETGLIHQIGLWVVHRACRDWAALKTLIHSESPFLNVNISGRQLADPEFAVKVIAIQKSQAIHSSELKFELTETTLIENPELAHTQLRQLTEHGNAIILDDYGIGYSGLGHLQRYNFTGIKLDQSFIKEMLHSKLSLQLIISSIEMAKKLQLEVVAEGIETPEIAQALKMLGCTLGQGFLFSKGKPLDELLQVGNTGA
jgi:EAL domain-containing protein (putative c-di-GMP-specific phosphodiesterase class I)